jgi:integrase
MRSRRPSNGRNVKSAAPVDAHERRKNFLSDAELIMLLEAMKQGRHGIRDHLLVLMMYRHGLRVSEAIGLRRDDVDLDHARLWVRRLKHGLDVEHPIAGDELRIVKRYLATRVDLLPLAFHLRTRATARTAVRELPRRRSGRARRIAAGASAHDASLLRILARQSRLRSTPDPGLPRTSRSQAHRPLYPHRRRTIRGSMAVSHAAFPDF